MTAVDTQRLYATTDASVWAEEFAKVHPEADRGLMIGWFANAIENAKDHIGRSKDAEIARLSNAVLTLTDSGLRYCVTHHGKLDVDEDGACDFARVDTLPDEQADCVLVPLLYRRALDCEKEPADG